MRERLPVVGETLYRGTDYNECEPITVIRVGTQWVSYTDPDGSNNKEQLKYIGQYIFFSVEEAIHAKEASLAKGVAETQKTMDYLVSCQEKLAAFAQERGIKLKHE